MKITPSIQSFVLHFGEMGSRWGVNRTVGQLYALLMVTEKALTAEELAQALNLSRGNVSMGLKELQSWRLVRVQHLPGDRKDYYLTDGDIWDMARKVLEERRKREIDPTLTLLRNLLMNETAGDADDYALQRIREIHDLLEMVTLWSRELQEMKPEKLATLMKLGAGVSKVIDLKDKLLAREQAPKSDT